MQAAGHEKVARPLGSGLNEHRGLNLQELPLVEEIAHRFDDPVAHGQIALQTRAAQIQIAVLHAQILIHVLVRVHGERRHE